MNFFQEYPYFRGGVFFDSNWNIKASVSDDGIIKKYGSCEIVGRIKGNELYDRCSCHIGTFKDKTLYDIGGNIRGHALNLNLSDDTLVSSKETDFHISSLLPYAGVLVLGAQLVHKIMEVFF